MPVPAPRNADGLLASVVDRFAARAPRGEVILAARGRFGTAGAAAGPEPATPVGMDTAFHTASASKLFGTAMILALADRGVLTLDDPLLRFFPDGETAGLHCLNGQDRTAAITLRHLLSHRSGLPDYFGDRRHDGSRFESALLGGQDRDFGLADVLHWARDDLSPRFPPGAKRAHYSDTNFYLLGEVIARASGLTLDAALARFVTGPLGLQRTRFFHPGQDVLPLRNGDRRLHLPRALAAMPVDGGGVTTAADLLRFTEGFFTGRLFDPAWLPRLMAFRPAFFPMEAGIGLMRFRLPRIVNLFARQPALIGHSGVSGAFAFAVPDRGLYLAGTTNQLADRSRPYRLALAAAGALARA